MMDIKNFTSAVNQIAEEKGIPQEAVIDIIEQAYAAAYKKEYGKKGQIIKAKLSPSAGDIKFWQIKLVVDENMVFSEEEWEKLKESEREKAVEKERLLEEAASEEKIRFNPEKHILIKDAKKISKTANIGDELKITLKTEQDYGRIAAQTAKQVILQRIKEMEREAVLGEYKTKEGEVMSGILQRIEGANIYFDLGKTLGILTKEEQVPGEFYKPGQRLKLYILKVEESPKGPLVFLSRAYPKLISKLFEIEAPEVSQGLVVIKSIAREAGSRTKIAVESIDEKVDPIGSVVGQKGIRVSAVINELGGEKIDIIEYADDPQKFIANALSPAKVLDVEIKDKNKALCLVPEDQLSLAIGKNGQNVRLAAKLTGWKIDVRPPEDEIKEAKEAKEKPAKKEIKKVAAKTKKQKE